MNGGDRLINMSDPEPQFININGESFCYRISGSGENTIILLHGLAETSKYFWREFILHFQGNYKIIAVDLRGHGNSEKPINGYSPFDQANLIVQIINKLEIYKPIILGHSLGGIIATQLAISHPEILAKLIIYDSPIGDGFLKNLNLIINIPIIPLVLLTGILIPGIGRLLFTMRSAKTMRLLLNSLKVFYDPSYLSDELIAESMKNSYSALVKSIWLGVIFQKLQRYVHKITVPTLIIRGEFDYLVPKKLSKEAASQILNCKVVEIENASHLALIEQPNQFNEAVSQFLL